MNRFIDLDFDTSSESSDSNVVDTTNSVTTPEVKSTKKSKAKKFDTLSRENLTKLGEAPVEKRILCEVIETDPLITKAKSKILDMVKNYSKFNPLNKLDIYPDSDFTKYMSQQSSPYFTKLYKGGYTFGGSDASITTWMYGKNPDGTSLYLYITTVQNHGTCDGCDRLMSYEHSIRFSVCNIDYKLERIKDMNLGKKSEYFQWKDEKDRIAQITVLKKEVHDDIALVRRKVFDFVSETIGRLKIHKSYNAAVNEIRRSGDFTPPKFIDALKEAFPGKDFSNLEKSIQERPRLLKGQSKNLVSDYIKVKG